MTNDCGLLTKRFARPQTLASAFGGLMQLFGAPASASDLEKNWDKIVGNELAALGKISGIRKSGKQFNISVKATVPAMATELSYRLEEFRICINKYFGYGAVNKIRIR